MDKAKDEAINKLIKGQEKMGEDITEMKADIADLKVSQQQFEGLINKVIDGIARIERVVVNIENDLRPKVYTLLDADKIRQDDTTEFKQVCREQEKQLTDHELRISHLEKKR